MSTEAGPRRALVTGASRGIGLAIAKALAGRGIEVYAASRSAGAVSAPEGAAAIHPVALDLSDPDSVARLAADLPSPDILVNNAGVSQIGAAEEVPLARLRALFEINFFGTVDLTTRLLPAMRERAAADPGPGPGHAHRACIINVGSLAGRFPVPFQSAYVASKSALAGWTACLRSEVHGLGIEACLVEPADIRTTIEPERIISEDPDSPYTEAVQAMGAARDQAMDEANPPEKVAATILAIIDGRGSRPVRAVGGNAPFLCFLKRLLPDTVVEKLIRKRYRLP